jgi:hypothetical protein
MTTYRSRDWTRRRVLRTIPAVLAPALAPLELVAMPAAANPQPPFSKFVDIAQSAGLHETMTYGGTTAVTYIIESMGGGCAFFDYDNDGWMDIFILGGRKLEGVPEG